MVDLKELDMFESDVKILQESGFSCSIDCKRVITQQQSFIKSLAKENERLREYILDGILSWVKKRSENKKMKTLKVLLDDYISHVVIEAYKLDGVLPVINKRMTLELEQKHEICDMLEESLRDGVENMESSKIAIEEFNNESAEFDYSKGEGHTTEKDIETSLKRLEEFEKIGLEPYQIERIIKAVSTIFETTDPVHNSWLNFFDAGEKDKRKYMAELLK